jgi:hypothetical protein
METPERRIDVPTADSKPLVSLESASVIDSVALARLIEEVRIEPVAMGSHYNRTYNRHNR